MHPDPATIQPDAHIWERAKLDLRSHSCDLLSSAGRQPKQWGSGVLLACGDAAFLVTASHVMEIVGEKAEILIGSMSVGARGLISLGDSNPVVRTKDDEKLDLALVRLSESAIEALAPLKQFVLPSEVDLNRVMPQGRYFIAGYPIQLTQTDHTSKTITVGSFTYTTHLTDSDHVHPGVSIALARGKDSITRGDDGEPARSPELRGVSGCGIWRLWANEQADQLADWNETWIELVGIEHRTAGEAIIGTMAAHVYDMLLRTQPVEVTLTPERLIVRVR